jgi:hypothetical protein
MKRILLNASRVVATAVLLLSTNTYADDACCDVYCGEDSCFTLRGEAVWAEVCQNIPYARTVVTGPPQAETTHLLEHDWELGLRLAAGINVTCYEWGLGAEWTYLKHDAESTNEPDLGNSVGGLVGLNASTTASKDDLKYNVADVFLNYPVHLCQGLTVIPYGGARGLWIDRTYNETNTGGSFAGGSGDTSVWHNDYEAYGLVGGLEWRIQSGCNFSFFGKLGASAVRGEEELNDSILVNTVNTQTHALSDDRRIAASTDLAIGAAWLTCMCDTEVAIQAAYTFTHWHNLRNPISTGSNDMSVNGIIGGLYLGF